MRRLFRHFGPAHAYLFLAFYLLFATLTFLALSGQSESDRRESPRVAATIGSVSGPFTGAIARNFQSCCWQSSLSNFPYSLACLLVGLAMQIVPLPGGRFERPLRLTLWCVGLLGWFGGAIVSFGHALC